MKVLAVLVVVLSVVSTYQINKYSSGYYKLLVANETNEEAMVAQDLKISFLENELTSEIDKNYTLINSLKDAVSVIDIAYVAGCVDSGKTEKVCLKMIKNKASNKGAK